MKTSRENLLKEASKRSKLLIVTKDMNNIKAHLEAMEMFGSSDQLVWVVEFKVFSARNSLAHTAYFEFPYTVQGKKRADRLINWVMEGN